MSNLGVIFLTKYCNSLLPNHFHSRFKISVKPCRTMVPNNCSKDYKCSSIQPKAPSLSQQKASRSNPRPHFSNCIQNDVTSVRPCLTCFRKKNNCILLVLLNRLSSAAPKKLNFKLKVEFKINIRAFIQF